MDKQAEIAKLNNMMNELFVYNSKLSTNYDEKYKMEAEKLKKEIDKSYNKIFKNR